MIQMLGTILAALFGLAFGSFANVCISRWPEGESVIRPGSHCRNCGHALAAWENLPILSWIALRGRCRQCGAPIALRNVLVEAVMGALWACAAWISLPSDALPDMPRAFLWFQVFTLAFTLLFIWLLVVLAVLDAKHFWLPEHLTWTGIGLGIGVGLLKLPILIRLSDATGVPLAKTAETVRFGAWTPALELMGGVVTAAGLVLLVRWLYRLIRKREGMGLGDVKLMALLAAWLGFPGALLAFGLGAVSGAIWALMLLAIPARRTDPASWAASKLPFGTFLCMGGIVSALWGHVLIAAYLHWAQF